MVKSTPRYGEVTTQASCGLRSRVFLNGLCKASMKPRKVRDLAVQAGLTRSTKSEGKYNARKSFYSEARLSHRNSFLAYVTRAFPMVMREIGEADWQVEEVGQVNRAYHEMLCSLMSFNAINLCFYVLPIHEQIIHEMSCILTPSGSPSRYRLQICSLRAK